MNGKRARRLRKQAYLLRSLYEKERKQPRRYAMSRRRVWKNVGARKIYRELKREHRQVRRTGQVRRD